MGLGDWIMSTGEAEKVEGKVVIGNGAKVYWDEVFEGNPKIAKEASRETRWLLNYPGHRPYIKSVTPTNFVFDENYRAPYGRLYISERERAWAEEVAKGDFILVEPHVKDAEQSVGFLGKNKAWDKWDELLKLDYPWLQIGKRQSIPRFIETKSFRRALAILERAKLLITTDGALHHAAAALGVPSIVLWGGVASPKVLGYPTQVNIWNGADSCGTFAHKCEHCKQAMASITVDQVRKHI